MIQKYVDENVLLIPNTVFKERENYDFLWTIDKRFKLTGYNASYKFSKPGTHNIVLKVVDKVTEQSSIFTSVVNIIHPEQEYAPPFVPVTNFGFGLGEFGYEDFGD